MTSFYYFTCLPRREHIKLVRSSFSCGGKLTLRERGWTAVSLQTAGRRFWKTRRFRLSSRLWVESSLPEPISRRHFTPVSNSFTLISNSLQRGKSNEISGKSFPHFHFETVLLLIPRNIS